MGRFELKQITKMLNFVRTSMEQQKAEAQMHRARKKMVQDLHHRSMVRVATEECKFAANHHPHDVANAEFINAEFIRTYRAKAFLGGKLSQRLDVEKNSAALGGE